MTMDRTTLAKDTSTWDLVGFIVVRELESKELIRNINRNSVYLPPAVLPDGQVHLHVEDDQAQQGQDHCEEKVKILFVDLKF